MNTNITIIVTELIIANQKLKRLKEEQLEIERCVVNALERVEKIISEGERYNYVHKRPEVRTENVARSSITIGEIDI